MTVKQRMGRLPGTAKAIAVVGVAVALIGTGSAVAFAGTANGTGGTPALSTMTLPAKGPDGQQIDPADLPAPGGGQAYTAATIDENGNVTTSSGSTPPPAPDGTGGPLAIGTGGTGEPIAGAQAALMKMVEVGAGETTTESFTAPDMAPKLGEVQPAPDGLAVTSAVTGAGTADDPQVITLTITNTTDAAVTGPVGMSFVQ